MQIHVHQLTAATEHPLIKNKLKTLYTSRYGQELDTTNSCVLFKLYVYHSLRLDVYLPTRSVVETPWVLLHSLKEKRIKI